MTTFRRRGHWRISKNGTRHWVGPHKVTRDGPHGDWHSPRYIPPLTVVSPSRVVRAPEASPTPTSSPFRSLVAPNASCPVCSLEVYCYANTFGARVYFDVIGPPWTRHPCIPPSHTAQSAWEASRDGELIMPDARTATSREAWATVRAVEVVTSEHHIPGGLVVTVTQRVSGRQGTIRWLDQAIDVPPAGSLLFEHGGRVSFISRALELTETPIALLGGDLEFGRTAGDDHPLAQPPIRPITSLGTRVLSAIFGALFILMLIAVGLESH